ncbi:hypothetical protein [Hyphobacterium indicum]|uniref:hypothetical protein n=1 Tax=Hyphobacterium indicum TaxID=2162714 RepID=UPI000F63F3DC|nr:hypothetical protein [Hyphobacterium indicum]
MQQLSGGLGMTVLIYSQSRPLQQALQSSLYAMGCKAVVTAGSVEEAGHALSVQHIEAALVTDTSAASALQQISPALPLLSLTNDETPSGVTSLKKPFRIQDLEASLIHSVSVSADQAPAMMAL